MTIGGLWHGAGLNYLLWGAMHGTLLVIERPLLSFKERFTSASYWHMRLINAAHTMVVFIFVTWAWLLFKLPTLDAAIVYTKACFQGSWLSSGLPFELYLAALCYAAPVAIQHFCNDFFMHGKKYRIEPMFYALLVLLAIVEAGPEYPFIYFQF